MKSMQGLLAITSLLLTACATKNSLKANSQSSSDGLSSQSTPRNRVVQQVGSKRPLLSTEDFNHWVQLSESDESSTGKVYGLLAVGDWQPAIQEARRNLEKNPGNETLMVVLGAAFASGKNYEMGGYYGSQALKYNPQNADAMNLVGLRIMMSSENRRGDFDDAISWFRKAADTDGAQVASLLNMGYLQLDLGDTQNALESFRLASSRCENCFDSQYGYGIASARSMSWENARSAFEGILEKDSSRADALFQLALIYKNGLNNPKECEKLLQTIVSDADGRFKHASEVKRIANITLRRLKASDRSAPLPEETIMPRGGEMPARAR